MTKVTLDMSSFKALASDTRLNILKSLDGKKMNLKDISKETELNKATLHEHLNKLSEAGLVKRIERKGHKWVYYKLTWKGEGLLHPENTRIVVLFSLTFIALAAGIVQFIRYLTVKVSNTIPRNLNDFGSRFGKEAGDLVKNGNVTAPNNGVCGVSDGVNSTIHDALDSAVDPSLLTKYSVIRCGNGNVSLPGTFDLLSEKTINSNPTILPFLKDNLQFEWKLSKISTNQTVNSTTSKLDTGANFAAEQTTNFTSDPMLLYIAIGCFILFASILCISIWRYKKNKTPKL